MTGPGHIQDDLQHYLPNKPFSNQHACTLSLSLSYTHTHTHAHHNVILNKKIP